MIQIIYVRLSRTIVRLGSQHFCFPRPPRRLQRAVLFSQPFVGMPKKAEKSLEQKTMDDVFQCLKSALPRGGESAKFGFDVEVWENCFTTTKNQRTEGYLTALDMGRNAMSLAMIPLETITEAAKHLWLENKNPSFLNHVILEVSASSFVFGYVHRLSDDVPCISLAYAIWKTHQDRDTAKYTQLLELAKVVPYELRYVANKIDGWFEGARRVQLKHSDAKYEQSTLLAYGDSAINAPLVRKFQTKLTDLLELTTSF